MLKTQLLRGLFTLPLIAMMLLANLAHGLRADAFVEPAPLSTPAAAEADAPRRAGGDCDKDRLPVVRHLAFSSPTDLPRRALRMPQDCTAA